MPKKKTKKLTPLQLKAMFTEIHGMNNASIELQKISLQEDSKKNQKITYILPSIVLSAFTCELCLKSMLAMKDVEIDNEHNLLNLYQSLNSVLSPECIKNIQQNTETHFLKECKSIESVDFDKELNIIADSFIDLRYFYEKVETPKGHLVNLAFLEGFKFALIQQFVKVETEYAAMINSSNIE